MIGDRGKESRPAGRDRSPAGRPEAIPAPREVSIPPRYAPGFDLPAYRFVPRSHPHPTRDPLGHSYGAPEPRASRFSAQEWAREPLYLWGVDLFNRRYYWEAHEAWEAVWRASEPGSTQRLFLQGLILVAASFVKCFEGNARGTRRLHAKALAAFDRALAESPGEYMGVPLRSWLDELAMWMRGLPGHPSPPPTDALAADALAADLPVLALRLAPTLDEPEAHD